MRVPKALAADGKPIAGRLAPEEVARVLIAVQVGLELQWLYNAEVDIPEVMEKLMDVLIPLTDGAA